MFKYRRICTILANYDWFVCMKIHLDTNPGQYFSTIHCLRYLYNLTTWDISTLSLYPNTVLHQQFPYVYSPSPFAQSLTWSLAQCLPEKIITLTEKLTYRHWTVTFCNDLWYLSCKRNCLPWLTLWKYHFQHRVYSVCCKCCSSIHYQLHVMIGAMQLITENNFVISQRWISHFLTLVMINQKSIFLIIYVHIMFNHHIYISHMINQQA